MSTRVVLLCEGSGESGGALTVRPSPGERLDDSQLGAAHLLVRRSLARAWSRQPLSFVFHEPLRMRSGRSAQGSQLLDRRNLRQLHDWARPDRAPHISIVLVDGDEVRDRRESLSSALEAIERPRWVVAIAVQEFEAWLIADQQVLKLLGQPVPDQSPDPENLKRREAKRLLDTWIEKLPDANDARRELAQKLDLDVLSRRCPSFARFLADIDNLPEDCRTPA